MISLSHIAFISIFLFTLGIAGFLIRKSAIIVFLSVELMINSASILFVAGSRFFAHLDGALFVLFVLAISACEAAIGIAIVVAFIRKKGSANVDDANLMRW